MATGVEWTDETWNPTTGCTRVGPGCKNCYAARMSKRLKAMGQPKYQNGDDGFELTLHPDVLEIPLKWKKPKKIFVDSMSDLFHYNVPFDFIIKVLQVAYDVPQHIYQILTKRSDRLRHESQFIFWPDNVWMGVSVENADYKFRIEHLRQTSAKVKFLSLEPLLGSLGKLDLTNIDWVITGGESGPGCRPIEANWVREIRDQCIEQDVAFFFKQWGGSGKQKKKNGRSLDGEIWEQFPISRHDRN